MCGIAGFFSTKNIPKVKLEKTAGKLISALKHRGPDDNGYYCEENTSLFLCHTRLSILDLSNKGKQPMAFCGKVIVYNGEIYNYLQLKEELLSENDVEFQSTSDTEVLLKCLHFWGVEKTLKKANGMFAFALWDREEKKIILARDRVGIKPLYYGIVNRCLYFASELKGIAQNDFFNPELDMDSLSLFFKFGYIPFPYSIYKGIKKLKQGCFVEIDSQMNERVYSYWNLLSVVSSRKNELKDISYNDALCEFERILKSSVKKRLISDVKVGAFLSGGVDSSLISSIASGFCKINTFTVGFYEKEYDESSYARKVAEKINSNYTEIFVSIDDAKKTIPKIPVVYDEPFADSSQIPTMLISELTRKYVKVSLSGDGGDELFGGYNRYYRAGRVWPKLQKIPFIVKKFLSTLIEITPVSFLDAFVDIFKVFFDRDYRQYVSGDRIKKFSEMITEKDFADFYKAFVSHWKKADELVLGKSGAEYKVFDMGELYKSNYNYFELMMLIDFFYYLPDDILVKVDRASMSVGLEARVPFLDHKIAEFVYSLPMNIRIRADKRKAFLKDILKKYVPSQIIERPKKGFGIPLSEWMRKDLSEWVDSLLNEKKIKNEGILDYKKISKKWDEHRKGRRNWSYYLWDVIVFESWLEKNKL